MLVFSAHLYSSVLRSEPEKSEESSVSGDVPLLLPEPCEDKQIVTLVEEEEDEDLSQSTVTLLEAGEEDEEEKRDEKMRKETDRNQWESQTYCSFSPFTSLSLSCVVTLPELLHRWCSARLAKERLRSFRKRQLSSQTLAPPAAQSPVPQHTPPPVPAPTPPQEALPLTDKAPEPEVVTQGQSEGSPHTEVHTADTQTDPLPSPDAHTPDSIVLEPSRTSPLPPHSISDAQSSLVQPTPVFEDKLFPSVKDAAPDPVPTPPLQPVSVPETQQASSATLSPSVSSSQPPASEKTSSSTAAPSVKDQPVLSLPTASRPEDLLPPPTELPAAFPPPDIHTDSFSGTTQRLNIQTPPAQGEQGDTLTQTEPHQGEDTVEGDLVNTNGNQRTATDFYAELQNGLDYNGGTGNGNGGSVHGSSQKESVFMRLNNRIKALEMNMSLSSRYLEELSQR